MSRSDRAAIVSVRDELGRLLMIRSSVSPLFRKISRLRAARVVVDFSNVEFMSRSFADEYLQAKTVNEKSIEERHMPEEVARMLRLVSNQRTGRPTRSPARKRGYPQPQMISSWRPELTKHPES